MSLGLPEYNMGFNDRDGRNLQKKTVIDKG